MSVYHPLSVNASIPRHLSLIYSVHRFRLLLVFHSDEAEVVLSHPSFLTPYPSRAVRHAEERAQGLGPRALRSELSCLRTVWGISLISFAFSGMMTV